MQWYIDLELKENLRFREHENTNWRIMPNKRLILNIIIRMGFKELAGVMTGAIGI